MGSEFALSTMLTRGPDEALLLLDHLQVCLEEFKGIVLIALLVAERAEFPSSLLWSCQFTASWDDTEGERGYLEANFPLRPWANLWRAELVAFRPFTISSSPLSPSREGCALSLWRGLTVLCFGSSKDPWQ